VTTRHFSEADLPSGEGESRAVHLAFINQNLDIGAATAWQGYQTMGWCAIVVGTQWADCTVALDGRHDTRGYHGQEKGAQNAG